MSTSDHDDRSAADDGGDEQLAAAGARWRAGQPPAYVVRPELFHPRTRRSGWTAVAAAAAVVMIAGGVYLGSSGSAPAQRSASAPPSSSSPTPQATSLEAPATASIICAYTITEESVMAKPAPDTSARSAEPSRPPRTVTATPVPEPSGTSDVPLDPKAIETCAIAGGAGVPPCGTAFSPPTAGSPVPVSSATAPAVPPVSVESQVTAAPTPFSATATAAPTPSAASSSVAAPTLRQVGPGAVATGDGDVTRAAPRTALDAGPSTVTEVWCGSGDYSSGGGSDPGDGGAGVCTFSTDLSGPVPVPPLAVPSRSAGASASAPETGKGDETAPTWQEPTELTAVCGSDVPLPTGAQPVPESGSTAEVVPESAIPTPLTSAASPAPKATAAPTATGTR